MLATILLTLAQTATTQPDAAPGWARFLRDWMFPIAIGLMVLVLFTGKKQKGEDKKRTDRLANLGKGDQIQTIGGVIGTVTNVDGDVVTVKVDETTNTKIKFSRTAIHRVLTEEPSK